MTLLQALRLTYLAWFLNERVPDKHFNLRSYLGSKKYGNNPVEIMNTITEGKPECGTTACALGWCPYAFPNDWMFGTSYFGTSYYSNRPYPRLSSDPGIRENTAAIKYFGLTEYESHHLFYALNNRTVHEEHTAIVAVLLNHTYMYDKLLESALVMFGADRTVETVCPAEQTPEGATNEPQ